MQLTAVNKTKAGTFEMSYCHSDINLIRVLFKINDFNWFMPVMLDCKWKTRWIGFMRCLVKCTWKTEISMLSFFF